MNSERGSGPASAFDKMLEQNKHRLDALDSRPRSAPPPTARPAPTTSRRETRQSPIERRLSRRFGDDWSYEIGEDRRVGDEIVIDCRITLADGRASEVGSGRARISDGGGQVIQGTADGIAFALLAGGEDGMSAAAREEAAFGAALDRALVKCEESL